MVKIAMTSKRPASSSNVIFDSSLVNFGGNGGFEKSVHHYCPQIKWQELSPMVSIDIGRTFLFYKTTKEIWDAAKETFSDSENAAEVFEIKSQLLELYWQKLDVFEEMEWDCVHDSIKYHKIMEKERIFTFLACSPTKRELKEGHDEGSHLNSPFRATMDQPWPPRDQILNTLIHEGDPTSHGVIIVIKLVIHEKPIGKFMGSRPIGKGTKHKKMNLELSCHQ
ncbi:hypothetical protein CK203_096117 [Vitis vinifera]|uniref:Uncharacterized protein n=1 Tax=Vitis vinifera TaxID=29760 RepID=A0A438DV65_VITVI|nr:hypothetical protein CK203_096117 [Vitis vinifera]